MEKVFASDDFKQRFGVFEIKHIMIPLYSPWQIAVWEYLIRTVKNCLRKSIGRSYLDYFRLVTVLSDIQHAINCRPLTYHCSDYISLEVLTPNHFLKPNVETNLFFIVKYLELREKILLNFKRLWYEE